MSDERSDAVIGETSIVSDRILPTVLGALYRALVYATVLFLIAPLAIVVIISFQEQGYGGWPPQQWAFDWYTALPGKVESLGLRESFVVSIEVAVATMLVTTVLGGLVALSLTRYDFRYSTALETLFLSPLIYPWLVTGFAILLVIGELNSLPGVQIRMSFWTLLAGHSIVTIPFPIRTILASLQNFDRTIEEAASDLGATELETYYRITLPLIKPGIVSGAIFAFILSFNQYIVSLFLSGTDTQTMPLRLFNLFYDSPPQQLAALGTILMAGILIVILFAERWFGISEYM
jgi:putative spermidine/putrescine transport system permease protein